MRNLGTVGRVPIVPPSVNKRSSEKGASVIPKRRFAVYKGPQNHMVGDDKGRGLQGRDRGFDMGSITVPDRTLQRHKEPSVTLVFCKLRPSFSLSRHYRELSGIAGKGKGRVVTVESRLSGGVVQLV
jgi:hypothetical protein